MSIGLKVIIWDKFGVASFLENMSINDELVVPGMLPAFFISLFCIIIVSVFTVPPETKRLFANPDST